MCISDWSSDVCSSDLPAVARKDKPAVDPVCDPLTQSIRRNTSAAGLLIVGFDGDGDAAIDKAELKAGTERMFSVADSDRNGELSLIELSEWADRKSTRLNSSH